MVISCFIKQKTAYEMRISDWSSDVCSSDLTQVRVDKELGIKQENVSRIEKRTDLLISTLSGYVEAMGGKLRLVAEFPDRPPVTLSGIAVLDKEERSSKQ